MAEPDVFLGPTPEFPALMTGQLTAMRDNHTLTDFTITVQDDKTKLPCHKVILAIHSPYLTAMFTTDMVEAANKAVNFKDISLKTMKLILDYCYSEQICFSSGQLMSLIIASDYLQIERLKKRCVNEVKTFLNIDNVLTYLTFSCEQHMKDLEDIKTWCTKIIVKSFSEVSEQPAFLALTYDMLQECVKEVVRSDVTLDDVLRAICKWVNENVESRGQYLEKLLQQVQLDDCSLPAILHVMLTYATMLKNCKVLGLLAKSVTKHTTTINASTEPAKGKTFLNPENVLQYLTFAGEHGLQDIKTWCLEVVVNSFPEVYKLPAFLALSFAELQDVMAELAQSDVESDDVLRAVFKWVNDDAESRGKHLEELLDKVQLDKCSLRAIHDVMETDESMIVSHVKVFSILTKTAKQLTAMKNQPTKKTLVIVGGQVDTKPNLTCWGVDINAKTLTKSFTIPFDKLAQGHNVCETSDGFALTGGEDSDMCVLFVASTMSWRKMPNMKRKRCLHGSIYIKGILYVMCGWVSLLFNKSASVDCLTLAGGKWESLPDVPIAVLFPNVAELNGKAFMLDSSDGTKKLYRFDVEKNEWKERASLPGADIYGVSMIAVNGQLCVAGGGRLGGTQGICAWYNPAINTWNMSEQKPSKKHYYGSLVQVDATTLMLLGGSFQGGTDEIEELNIEEGCWCVKEWKMPAKMYLHKALILEIPQITTSANQ